MTYIKILNGLLFRPPAVAFSKCWHGVKNPYEVLHEREEFFLKKFLLKKWKFGRKWVKNRVF